MAGSKRRQASPLTVWFPQSKAGVKTEVQRRAAQHGISTSAYTAALIEMALTEEMNIEQAATLQPKIRQAMRHQLRPHTWLLIRIAHSAEVIVQLLYNFMKLHPATQKTAPAIYDNAHKTAKHNMLRKIPDLTEPIEAFDTWMEQEGDKAEKVKYR